MIGSATAASGTAELQVVAGVDDAITGKIEEGHVSAARRFVEGAADGEILAVLTTAEKSVAAPMAVAAGTLVSPKKR